MGNDVNMFVKFVKTIVSKPGMFGVNKVEDINLVILGYIFKLSDNNINVLLSDFTTFINNEFKTSNSYHWSNLIRLNSGVNDSHSIKLFTDVFEKFLKSKRIGE